MLKLSEARGAALMGTLLPNRAAGIPAEGTVLARKVVEGALIIVLWLKVRLVAIVFGLVLSPKKLLWLGGSTVWTRPLAKNAPL